MYNSIKRFKLFHIRSQADRKQEALTRVTYAFDKIWNTLKRFRDF